MTALNLCPLIADYSPMTDQEKGDKEMFLYWMSQYPETILTRQNPFAHMTSSGFVFNETFDHCLMVFHNIYKSWSWSGGHADGCEDLLSVALKEAYEETGLENIRPFTKNPVSLDVLPVLGHFKQKTYVSAHLHLSVAYALVGDMNRPLKHKADENAGVAWIPLAQLEQHCSELHMLPIYQKIIKRTKP